MIVMRKKVSLLSLPHMGRKTAFTSHQERQKGSAQTTSGTDTIWATPMLYRLD